MNDRLSTVKNFIWALCILVSSVFLLVGTMIVVFRRYDGEKVSYGMTLSENAGAGKEEAAGEEIIGASSSSDLGSGNARGTLNTLSSTEDAGESYLADDGVIFLVDSTFIGLRSKGIISSSQVWGTESGSLSVDSLSTQLISFPNDGSQITPASAAMISKPRVLYIGIGTDGLAKTDENSFVAAYDALIAGIQSASPETVIVCMGLCSVTEDYSGIDGLSITVMSDGNDWIQLVCRDTGVYYLDVSENLGDGSGGLRASYCEANGKSLNATGLGVVLQTVRTHAVQ